MINKWWSYSMGQQDTITHLWNGILTVQFDAFQYTDIWMELVWTSHIWNKGTNYTPNNVKTQKFKAFNTEMSSADKLETFKYHYFK